MILPTYNLDKFPDILKQVWINRRDEFKKNGENAFEIIEIFSVKGTHIICCTEHTEETIEMSPIVYKKPQSDWEIFRLNDNVFTKDEAPGIILGRSWIDYNFNSLNDKILYWGYKWYH